MYYFRAQTDHFEDPNKTTTTTMPIHNSKRIDKNAQVAKTLRSRFKIQPMILGYI